MSSRAIDMLREEHRLILKVLGSLAALADILEQGKPVEREAVKRFAEFFRGFADRCHHAKEEDRLFVTMTRYGISSTNGPVAVMLKEHEIGRSHVRSLLKIGEGSGPLSDEERKEIVSHARTYRDLLESHIMKEDRILYPLGEQAIPASDLESLYEEFERFEQEVTGKGEHERWHALAHELIQAYPPNRGDGNRNRRE